MISAETIMKRLTSAQSQHLKVDSEILLINYKAEPLEGITAARNLICQLTDSPDDAISVACATAIASLENWKAILCELIQYAKPSPRVIRVMSRVLEAHAVQHVGTDLADRQPLIVTAAFDALWSDGVLNVRIPSPFNESEFEKYCLIGIDNPLELASECKLISITHSVISLSLMEPVGIVQPARSLIAPSLFVCAGLSAVSQ